MTTFQFGNANGLSVPVTTDNDTYIIGNGNTDVVNANGHMNDTVTLGKSTGGGGGRQIFRLISVRGVRRHG